LISATATPNGGPKEERLFKKQSRIVADRFAISSSHRGAIRDMEVPLRIALPN